MKSHRELARLLRANANEPWMTLGAKPFATEAARSIDELSDALDQAVTLCQEATARLRWGQLGYDLAVMLERFVAAHKP